MARIKRGTMAKKRKRKIFKKAKGYYSGRSKLLKTAREAVERAGQYAYRDRRQRKRQMKKLWITRLNAAVREHGLSYSRFMGGLALAGVDMDRKVLAEIAVRDSASFAKLVELAQKHLAQSSAKAA